MLSMTHKVLHKSSVKYVEMQIYTYMPPNESSINIRRLYTYPKS